MVRILRLVTLPSVWHSCGNALLLARLATSLDHLDARSLVLLVGEVGGSRERRNMSAFPEVGV